MADTIRIALAKGDGIGPEIADACLSIFEAAGVMESVEFTPVEMGGQVFAAGDSRGMTDEAIETIETTGLLYKGPMGTPIGGGGKSINVTLRKTFATFANLRHFQSLPGVDTVFSRAGVPVDIYVVRENIEDTYGGIEHRLTNDVSSASGSSRRRAPTRCTASRSRPPSCWASRRCTAGTRRTS
jgi:isocitrate dehydrogenase